MHKIRQILALALVMVTLSAGMAVASAANYGTVNSSDTVFFRILPSSLTSKSNLVSGCNTIPNGATVEILGTTGRYYWVQYNDLKGYIQQSEVTAGASAPQPAAPGIGSGSTDVSQLTVIATGTTKEKVYLRKAADKSTASANVVVTISSGKTVEIFSTTADQFWYYCRYDGKYVGYARVQDIKVASASGGTSGSSASGSFTAVSNGTTTGNVNFRTGPGQDYSKVSGCSQIPKNSAIEIAGMTTDSKWYYVRYKGYVGYVSKDYVAVNATSGTSSSGTATPASSGDTPVPSRLTSLSSSELAKWKDTYRQYTAAASKNSDCVGFIYVPGTDIYQPIMFSSSWYYDNHTPTKSSSSRGSIYSYSSGLCNITTITGHNMRGTAKKGGDSATWMFHELHHIKGALLNKSKCSYCGRSFSGLSDNTIFNITMGGYSAWELFAMYEVPKGTSSSVLKYNCYNYNLSGSALTEWINYQIGKSSYNFGVTPSANDKIMVVVTCGETTGDSNSRFYMFLRAIG